MAVVIEFRNESGFLQISESYQNLALRQKGTVVSEAAETGNTGWSKAAITVPVTAVIAFRSAYPCMIRSSSVSGSTKTVYFSVQGTSRSIDWYAFDTPDYGQVVDAVPYCVQVRRSADGVIAFDSRMRYMRVLQQLAGTGAANAKGTYNFASGTVPAVVQGPLCYQSQTIPLTGTGTPDPQVQYLFWGLTASMANTSVTVSSGNSDAYLYEHSSQVPIGLDFSQDGYSLLILDVANF